MKEGFFAARRADPLAIRSRRITRLFVNIGVIAVALWSVLTSVAPREEEPTAAGLWEKVDDSGRPEAWFRISECGEVYEGRIVKIFPKPGEDPSQWRCTKCEGDQKNSPVLGITFIKGMQRRGLTYENGTILDPRDGSVYDARMELSPDGSRLTVRGYLGISLLGQSQIWRRLPDSALDQFKTDSCGQSRPR
jgi:uncharacterized protein (DUF2147 family)